MKIDWFTVIAEVINFLVLVTLLKRFLYKPVLTAIAQREKKVVTEMGEAASLKDEATRQLEDFRQKSKDFEQQKKKLLEEAVGDAREERQKLLQAARKDAETLRLQLEAAKKAREESFKKELAEKTLQGVFNIAGKVLGDLADQGLEAQAVTTFIRMLEASPETVRQRIGLLGQPPGSSLVVRSAFELAEPQKEGIRQAVQGLAGRQLSFIFQAASPLIGGLEISGNGYKIGWNISGYLKDLEKNISDTFEGKAEKENSN